MSPSERRSYGHKWIVDRYRMVAFRAYILADMRSNIAWRPRLLKRFSSVPSIVWITDSSTTSVLFFQILPPNLHLCHKIGLSGGRLQLSG